MLTHVQVYRVQCQNVRSICTLYFSCVPRQRTVTRGVNKGVTEDFRAMLEKQVARCHEPPLPAVLNFLQAERAGILGALT